MKTQSALPWYGTDSEVAPQLAAYLDHCTHVTIPFCGGLAILPHLKAKGIIANDMHRQAINFYKFASGARGPLVQGLLLEMCKRTLSHPSEIDSAMSILDVSDVGLDAAWAFWALCWVGRKGKGGTKSQGGKPSIRRTADGGNNASRLQAAADDLREWAQHFTRCEWECQDFRVLLPKVADKPKCAIYVDPPWDGPGDKYLHRFDRQSHVDLRNLLERFTETAILVRYGDTPLIRELYHDWEIHEAESRDQANQMKGELWITRRCCRE